MNNTTTKPFVIVKPESNNFSFDFNKKLGLQANVRNYFKYDNIYNMLVKHDVIKRERRCDRMCIFTSWLDCKQSENQSTTVESLMQKYNDQVGEEGKVTKATFYRHLVNADGKCNLLKVYAGSVSCLTSEMQKHATNNYSSQAARHIIKHFQSKGVNIKRLVIIDGSSLQCVPTAIQNGAKGTSKDHGAVKIHMAYDALDNNVVAFCLTSGTDDEKKNAIELIRTIGEEGTLFIFDAGYVSKELIHAIVEANCYYSIRLGNNANNSVETVFDNDNNELPIEEYSEDFFRHLKKDVIDNIFLKNKKYLVVQGHTLNSCKKDVRERSICLRRGEPGEKTRRGISIPEISLIETNLPVGKNIKPEVIFDLYEIRWIIEILFKELKSGNGLNKAINSSKIELIFADILASILSLLLTRLVTIIACQKNKLLNIAMLKLRKLKLEGLLKTLIYSSKSQINKVFVDIVNKVIKICKQDKPSSTTLDDKATYLYLIEKYQTLI